MKQVYKGKTLTTNKCTASILQYYTIADKQDIAEGMNWYKEAHHFANKLAIQYYKTTAQVCGIIAAFSPQTTWLINKSFAISFLINPKSLVSSKERTLKAQKILKQADYKQIFNALSVNPNGAYKTKSFYCNILQPDNNYPVTIDRHAIAICIQKPHEVRPFQDNEAKINEKQYEFLANCYRIAAKELGILPNQLQAITWTVYRRLRELKSYSPQGYLPASNIEF